MREFGKACRWAKAQPMDPSAFVQEGSPISWDRLPSAARSFWQHRWTSQKAKASPEEILTEFDFTGQPEFPLPKLDTDELIQMLKPMRGKAPGADGYSGDQALSLPPPVLDMWTALFRLAEEVGHFPQALVTWKVVLIPKPTKTPGILTKELSATRPISLASVWYRAWAAARHAKIRPAMCHVFSEAQQDDAEVALLMARNTLEEFPVVSSLDLTACFDSVRTSFACATLRHLGAPTQVCDLLKPAWTGPRWVVIAGLVDRCPAGADALPQGDAMSCLALKGLMSGPAHQILRSGPTLVYVDDRTVFGKDVDHCNELQGAWMSFSNRMGWEENPAKIQMAHMGMADRVPITLLGAVLERDLRVRRRRSARDDKRAQDTAQVMSRIAALPGAHMRRKVFSAVATPRCWWAAGVTGALPTVAQRKAWMGKFRAATRVPLRASSPLLIATGWCGDVSVQLAARLFNALERSPVKPLGLCTLLHKQLSRLDCQEHDAGWDTPVGSISKDQAPATRSHLFRMLARFHALREWKRSNRRDAALAAETPVTVELTKSLHSFARRQDAPRLAVMVGGWITEAVFNRHPCGFCGEDRPSISHLAWRCRRFAHGRPPEPGDAVLARLGWSQDILDPAGHASVQRVLDWLASVRSAYMAEVLGR